MLLSSKNRKKILLFLYSITALCICSFLIKSISINKVVEEYNDKLLAIETNIQEEEEKLERLSNELEQVDSLDYIEKIAEDRLGLVQSDVIVIKKKEATQQ